jgi:FkbM family methyltransferase
LYKPKGVFPIQIDGMEPLCFAVHSKMDPWISGSIEVQQVFEPHILMLLQNFVAPGDVMLDIGANIGWFSVIGSRLVGNGGRVLAFEPDPFNLGLLRRNLKLNGCANVEVFPVAVSNKAGLSTLYRSADNQGDHQMAVIADRQDRIGVRTNTIDRMMARRRDRIGFVKIDTQGSETAILAGMELTVARNQGVRMIIEFWPHGLERCGSSVEALAGILCRLRRRLWLLHPDNETEPVDSERLVKLGSGQFSAETQRHADLVVVHPEDRAIIGFLQARERR